MPAKNTEVLLYFLEVGINPCKNYTRWQTGGIFVPLYSLPENH